MFPDSLLFLAGFVKRYYAVVSLPHICRRWLHRKACENDQRCFVFFVVFFVFSEEEKKHAQCGVIMVRDSDKAFVETWVELRGTFV